MRQRTFAEEPTSTMDRHRALHRGELNKLIQIALYLGGGFPDNLVIRTASGATFVGTEIVGLSRREDRPILTTPFGSAVVALENPKV